MRRHRPPDFVLIAALLLAAGAFLAAALAGPREAERRARDEVFATFALPGLGRSTDLSRCPASFDPRLGGGCALDLSPFPGSGPLCPDHALPPLGGAR